MRRIFPPLFLVLAALIPSVIVLGAENEACLSSDPADWPQPSKPYFMIAADTSGSMTACTNPTTAYPQTCNPGTVTLNSCGLLPTRYNDLKCALEQSTKAFAGQVNLGLATFAITLDSCPENCAPTCSYPADCGFEAYGCSFTCFSDEVDTTGSCAGCGPRPGDASSRAGAFIRVPIPQDHFWSVPPEPSNVQDLLGWVDSSCAGDRELYAAGATPLNGILRDMKRYFASGWVSPDGGLIAFPSPLDADDLAGTGINGGSACRDVNVILITDGDESCDTQQDAVNAADDLFQNGVTVGGKTFKIRTHVINFAGGTQTNTDAIASAGGTVASQFASNEVQLSQALSNIIAGAQSEICDNIDNNCNGCTDEGFLHYADTGQTCCAWSTSEQRETCLESYRLSVGSNPPRGDTTLLPCTTPAQQADPSTWLCYDPGDVCDDLNNNGVNGVDEGQLRCGDPPHCPAPETCNGGDDDCDGQVDEGGVCGACVSSPEVCDGCDNDCDGLADNGTFAPLACGQPSPANCVGARTCLPPQAVSVGGCAVGGGWGECTNAPEVEQCDGTDNDCNGIVDDGIVSVACEPSGTPTGLAYGGSSQCVKGQMNCGNLCIGFVGPTPEVTDGIDNDCNGVVDDFTLGTIVLRKQTLPANSSDTFTFTGAVSGSIPSGARIIAGALAPGGYGSTEQVPVGWTLKGIECDDANSTIDVPSATAMFQVEAGETVTCVFTNCVRDLQLSDQVVATTETFAACNTVAAGNNFTVNASGDVKLLAGSRVVLQDGFSVGAGGKLTVEIDAALVVP